VIVSPIDVLANARIDPAIVPMGIHHRLSERTTTAISNLEREEFREDSK
jgi:hypothetical protein